MPDIGALLEQHLGPIAASNTRVADALEAEAQTRSLLRGIKPIRLPQLIGTGANPFLLGGDVTPAGGNNATPDPGYVWSVRHLVIEGLTAGATPDVVNILRGGRIVWQLNGNQFAQTWGKGELLLNAGETFAYQSVGTFTATGKIIIHGMAVEVPGEMVGKFYA
jgi:hypothetical protein